MLDAVIDLRARWARGETTTNCWLALPQPFIAELASLAGFDSLCIDLQHGLVGLDDVTGMLQATAAARVPTLVRVPWNEPSSIMRVLDMGAAGVVVPLVETAEQAERAVAACTYPPRGNRSFGPVRAAVVAPDYFQRAHESLLIFVMIETKKGLDNLEAILDTPGLSGVYIGPADLSLSLGFPPESDSARPAHQDAIRQIVQACHQRGLVVGLHTLGTEFAAVAAAGGIDFVTIAADTRALSAELGRRVTEFHGLRDGQRSR